MVGAVQELLKHLIVSNKPEDCDEDTLIVDSTPIMTCCGRNRQGKVAREIADKGYCSTKNQYYHGLKLHLVGYRRKGHLPFPAQIVLSSASENDLTVFKRECAPAIASKAIKGATEEEKQRKKAADDLFSAAVSSVREPVKAFYSWLIDKTNIQRAQKCRSNAGLLIHTLGKLAIAFIFLIFNY